MTDRGRTVLFAALLAIVATMPLVYGANRDWIWPWFSAAFGGLAIVAAIDFGFRGWVLPQAWRQSPLTVGLLLAWAILPILHVLPGTADLLRTADRAAAQREALKSVLYVGVAFAVLLLADRRSRLRAFALCLFGVGAFEAGYAAFMTLSGMEYSVFGRKIHDIGWATGTFINRNHLAGCLEMAGGMGVGLLVSQLTDTEDSGWRAQLRSWLAVFLGPRIVLRALLALVVVALVLTQSRMGNAAFLFALGLIGVYVLIAMRPLPKSLLWLFASLVAVDVLILGSWVGVEKVTQRLQETRLVVDHETEISTEQERIEVSRGAFRLWQEAPLFGVGPGGFRVTFPAVKSADVSVFYDHAHNDWVQVLAERGVLGGLTMLGLVAAGFGNALLAIRRRHDPVAKGLAVGTAIALLSLAIHASVDFNWQIPANACWYFALIAFAAALRHGKHDSRENREPDHNSPERLLRRKRRSSVPADVLAPSPTVDSSSHMIEETR